MRESQRVYGTARPREMSEGGREWVYNGGSRGGKECNSVSGMSYDGSPPSLGGKKIRNILGRIIRDPYLLGISMNKDSYCGNHEVTARGSFVMGYLLSCGGAGWPGLI